jgi:hypothetical protein
MPENAKKLSQHWLMNWGRVIGKKGKKIHQYQFLRVNSSGANPRIRAKSFVIDYEQGL